MKTDIAEADSYELNSIRISKSICPETFNIVVGIEPDLQAGYFN